MKTPLLVALLLLFGITTSLNGPSDARLVLPLDNCTAATIGVQIAIDRYWNCANGLYPPPPCEFERLDVLETLKNVETYCNFTS